MQVTKVLTFEQALDKSENTKRNLLLGNGFSIACYPNIFNYGSLYEEAAKKIEKDMPEVHTLFEKSCKKDFETVITMLQNAYVVLPIYQPNDSSNIDRILKHVEQLKEILINIIAEKHPGSPSEISEEKFAACRKFLSHFIDPKRSGRILYSKL